MPDRETEAHVQRQVARRLFELITNDGVTVRRNQSSVRRLPEKSPEQHAPEQNQEEHTFEDGESENQETENTRACRARDPSRAYSS